jgi:hypothetical protein
VKALQEALRRHTHHSHFLHARHPKEGVGELQQLRTGRQVTGYGLHRQAVVHHRVRQAQRSVAAILPLLHRYPVPPRLLFHFYRSIVVPALVYEVATTASTKRPEHTRARGQHSAHRPTLKPKEIFKDLKKSCLRSPV